MKTNIHTILIKKEKQLLYKPFRPNIVHEPLAKDRVIEKIFDIPENERCLIFHTVWGLKKLKVLILRRCQFQFWLD